MILIKQPDDRSCQIVALQMVLSFYNIFPTVSDIKRVLPKHSFGNLITEMAVYLEGKGIKTKLISNKAKIRKNNKLYFDSLNEYLTIGRYEDRSFTLDDLKTGPVIVNVDWYKVKGKEKGIGAHYIVLLKDRSGLWIYDSSNFDKPKTISFKKVLKMSKNINRWKDGGLFLKTSR